MCCVPQVLSLVVEVSWQPNYRCHIEPLLSVIVYWMLLKGPQALKPPADLVTRDILGAGGPAEAAQGCGGITVAREWRLIKKM